MELAENYRPIFLFCILSKVLERRVCIELYNHVKQFTSPLQHVFFFMCVGEITPALHSCCLFLSPSVKAWTKIFKQMLSTWTLPKPSIPLVTQCYFKSLKHMVWKAARLPGLTINSAEDLKVSYWMVLLRNGPQLHQEFLGEPTRPSFICSLY